MLKPFYNKKKNIDNRLVPAVSAADAGKVLGVTEEGKIAAVDGTRLITIELTSEEFASLDEDIVTKDFPVITEFSNANLINTVVILTVSGVGSEVLRFQAIDGDIAAIWVLINVVQTDITIYMATYLAEIPGKIVFSKVIV